MKPIVFSVTEVAEVPVLDLGTRKVIPKAYLDEWLKENVKRN